MSDTHRQNYTPDDVARARALSRRSFIVAALLAAFVGVWAWVALQRVAPLAKPVRTPSVQITPLEPLDAQQLIAEIRIRAWRAGYLTAQQAHCRQAVAMPMLGTVDR